MSVYTIWENSFYWYINNIILVNPEINEEDQAKPL